jgi:UDP-galactopyranose mutase
MNQKEYDFLIVGAGFFGAICAYELKQKGYQVCVIDNRNHIGGNAYTRKEDGINIHEYGAHIFHTSNESVWKWINQFAQFNNYINSPVANYKGELYSLPFSMWTFSRLWNITTPEEAKAMIQKQSSHIEEASNLEEQAIKLVGTDIYYKLIKGYTEKQWRKPCTELPKSIINRLPVRFTFNNNYFNDKYQGIPIGGYTPIFEKLLEGVDTFLNCDYFNGNLPKHKKVIYTGPIDKYFNYSFGELEYKTVSFDHQKLEKENFQGVAVMNFTELEVPYTRIIEHKHFESAESPCTWISYEYPIEYKAGETDPYYPVNDETNNKRYQSYLELAKKETNLYFGGRLAEYKYYDMHQVIESALNFVKQF